MYAALSSLYASIQKDQPTMANALKGSCQQMGGGDLWVGPTADGWDSQLTGHSGDLARNVNAAVAEVASALASTPATCTAAEAKVEDMILSGRFQ